MIDKVGMLKERKKVRPILGIMRTKEGQKKFKEEIEEATKKIVELLKPLSVEQQNFVLELAESYIKVENSNSIEHLKEYKEIIEKFLR